MRSLVALVGWPEFAGPEAGWVGADAQARPMVLGYLGAGGAPAVAVNERRTAHAVLVGTLYNRRELRATLEGRHTLGQASDADVVLHLYEERGVQCVKALRGAFALALWDERRQRMFIARDALGLLPLYYAADAGRLAVASALPPLASLPGLGDAWDATALDAFLTLGAVPPPATFYPAIRQLGPGEMGVWEDGRLRLQRYWQLGFPARRMARDDLGEVFRQQVQEALRLRQAGVVTGLLLSGGLGSAALLALAAKGRRPPAAAYTLALPGGDGAEVRTAATLAEHGGVRHVVLAEPIDWPAAVDAVLAAHGSPAGGPETPLLGLAAARAAADGLRVALAGTGAAEVFGGTPAVRHVERLRRYRRLPALAREAAELWARLGPREWTTDLRRLIEEERLAPSEMYARATSRLGRHERIALYTPATLAALGDTRPLGALAELFAAAVAAGAEDSADAVHHVELAFRLPALASTVAVSAAAAGLELRLPLADHRLAQFVASVPPAERATATERQRLLRVALDGLVPPPVLEAVHGPLAPTPAAWAAGTLRALLEETLSPARVAAQGIFRADAVERMKREHLAGERDHAARLWALLLATRWVERRPARAVSSLRAAG